MTSRWVHDDEISECLNCRSKFNFFIRKHHCRKCGQIFCNNCCFDKLLIPLQDSIVPQKQFILPFDPREPQKVCNNCARILRPLQSKYRETISISSQETILDKGFIRELNPPIAFSLDEEIRKAVYSLYNFIDPTLFKDGDIIPSKIIADADGLVIMTVVRIGLMFTGRVGTGLVVKRLSNNSWSAPSAISCFGMGWGLQLGGEVTDVVLALHSVEAFLSSTQFSLGAEVGLAVGPFGRSAGTDLHAGPSGISAAFSYARSKGFFAGLSIETSAIFHREDVNESFYGAKFSINQLLSGSVPPPNAAKPLYEAIIKVENFNNQVILSNKEPDSQIALASNGFEMEENKSSYISFNKHNSSPTLSQSSTKNSFRGSKNKKIDDDDDDEDIFL